MSILSAIVVSALTQSAAQKPAPPRKPKPKINDTWNICVDGNSYYALWVYEPINRVGNLGKLITESSASTANAAVPGDTWEALVRKHKPDSMLKPGKVNVLVVGEHRNYLFKPDSTVEQNNAYVREYIAARRAAGWQYIILCGSIPDGGVDNADARRVNARLVEVEAIAEREYKAWGADAFVSFRKYAPQYFAGDGLSLQGYMNSAQTALEVQDAQKKGVTASYVVHPIGAAREAFANAIAAQMPGILDLHSSKSLT